MKQQKFIQLCESFVIDVDYQSAFKQTGLTSIEDVFAFTAGENLNKKNLASYRTRLQFDIGANTFFLKRYDQPPVLVQLKSWLLTGKKQSMALAEVHPCAKLNQAGINTPKVVCFGQSWDRFFEKRGQAGLFER